MLNHCNSAQAYFQTAFRCKTSYENEGIIKSQGNIYDFDTDRVLQVIPAILGENIKKASNETIRNKLGEFLNAMPVIAYHGNKLIELDVDAIMKEVKTIYARRIVDSGFESEEVIDKNTLVDLSNDIGISVEYFEKLFSSSSKNSNSKTTVSIIENNIPKSTREKED
jgi:hypothetical protein